jgi:hypothetical protein
MTSAKANHGNLSLSGHEPCLLQGPINPEFSVLSLLAITVCALLIPLLTCLQTYAHSISNHSLFSSRHTHLQLFSTVLPYLHTGLFLGCSLIVTFLLSPVGSTYYSKSASGKEWVGLQISSFVYIIWCSASDLLCLFHAAILLDLLFNTEHGGNMFFQSVG